MIHISDNLKNVLDEVRSSSYVADLLLRGNYTTEELQDSHADYLDISESDSTKISYLTPDRFAGVDPNTQNIWTCNRRYHARPGSVMNKVFKGISGRDIEIFNNVYKSALTRVKFKFKIISGNEIKDYYIYDRYHTQSGSLGASCMKYENCQRYFGMYVDNPEVISMITMVDDQERLMGRAILWNFDSYKVMDRIYTINDEELSYQFKKWAVDNGYMYKHEQKWNNSLAFELGGKKMEQKFCVQLKNWKYDKYPYMDTFKFLDRGEGKIYNYIPHAEIKTLCAPDGSQFPHDHLDLDFFTGLHHYRGEMVSIKYLDGKLIPDSTLKSHSSNVEWSRVNDMYIFRRDVKYSDEIDDYIFNDELNHLNDNEKIESYRAQILEDKKRREKEMMNRKMNPDLVRRIFSDRYGVQDSPFFDETLDPARRTRRVSQPVNVVETHPEPIVAYQAIETQNTENPCLEQPIETSMYSHGYADYVYTVNQPSSTVTVEPDTSLYQQTMEYFNQVLRRNSGIPTGRMSATVSEPAAEPPEEMPF